MTSRRWDSTDQPGQYLSYTSNDGYRVVREHSGAAWVLVCPDGRRVCLSKKATFDSVERAIAKTRGS